MRNALAPAFLLILGSMVLAATVFAEPLARAAAKPLESVLIGNDETEPVPVHEQGTVDVNVTSPVAIDPDGNTVQAERRSEGVRAGRDRPALTPRWCPAGEAPCRSA